jgi:hypothetical protein
MRDFYESERIEWSRRLSITLKEVANIIPPSEPIDDEGDQGNAA